MNVLITTWLSMTISLIRSLKLVGFVPRYAVASLSLESGDIEMVRFCGISTNAVVSGRGAEGVVMLYDVVELEVDEDGDEKATW